MLLRSCCTVTSSCKLYCFTTYGTSRQTCFSNTEGGELVVSLPIHPNQQLLSCTVVDRFSHVWTRSDVRSIAPTVLVVVVVEAACRSHARRFRRISFPCATYHAVEVQHVPLRLFEGGGVGRTCCLSQRRHRVRLLRRGPPFSFPLRSVPFNSASRFLSTRPTIPFEPLVEPEGPGRHRDGGEISMRFATSSRPSIEIMDRSVQGCSTMVVRRTLARRRDARFDDTTRRKTSVKHREDGGKGRWEAKATKAVQERSQGVRRGAWTFRHEVARRRTSTSATPRCGSFGARARWKC